MEFPNPYKIYIRKDMKMKETIINHYTNYDEQNRLIRDYSHKIEWLTTIKYLKKYIPLNSYILDGCAGTGRYAFELAREGYQVVANDIVPKNVDIIRDLQRKEPILKNITEGDITDLSEYSNETFDAVLCMGVFYHIDMESRKKALSECFRVLKPGGVVALAYINNVAVTYLNIEDNLKNMDSVLSCYENKTADNVFLHMNPDEIENMVEEFHAKLLAHISADGISYLFSNKVNTASEEDFNKYMELHYKICEDKHLLGYSLHGLAILKK